MPEKVLAGADLMAELRRRVKEKEDLGLYAIDALALRRGADKEPFDVDGLIRLHEIVDVSPDFTLTRSDKKHVGAAVTFAKRGMARASQQPINDLAARSTAFNSMLLAYLSGMGAKIAELEERLRAVEER